jgi:Holliday junction resolvase
MLERDIERKVGLYAQERGWLTMKFTSPGRRSVPDRIYISPRGQVVFIEFKMAGKKPTPLQEREHERLRKLKQIVLVVDNVETGKRIIDFLE